MKKLVFILCVVLFSFLFIKPAFAQDKNTLKTAYPLNVDSNVPLDFHTYNQNMFIETLSTATCFVGGVDLLNQDRKCLGVDPATKKIGYVKNGGGLAQVAGAMIGSTFDIPITTSAYARDIAAHFGITKTSYAMIPSDPGGTSNTKTGLGTGIGYVGLLPVINIWKAFRNLTYLLFVFIFIIIGLGIMFRLNIDARTVMTIQNQIPKIIIGLVLITFSYAIAGFLIDMMYVVIYLVIHIFDSQGLSTLNNIATNPVVAVGGTYGFGGVNSIAAPVASGVGGMISSLFDGTIGNILGTIVGGIIGGFIGGGLPFGLGAIGGAIAGAIFGNKLLGLVAMVIAYLIVSIAIFSALFRVWFMLIKAYIFILLDVIFGPFWILGGILPGAPGGVGPWLRSLLANLSAFPTVIILFMIGKTIQDQIASAGGNFVPPLVGNPGSNSVEAIGSIIGLGIILIMPEAVTMTKQAFKAPENKYVSSIGRAVGVGQGFISKPIGAIRHDLFGKDALGKPKEGTLWAQRKFGKVGRALLGGGITDKTTDEGKDLSMMSDADRAKYKVPWVRNPFKRKKPTDVAHVPGPGEEPEGGPTTGGPTRF